MWSQSLIAVPANARMPNLPQILILNEGEYLCANNIKMTSIGISLVINHDNARIVYDLALPSLNEYHMLSDMIT